MEELTDHGFLVRYGENGNKNWLTEEKKLGQMIFIFILSKKNYSGNKRIHSPPPHVAGLALE